MSPQFRQPSPRALRWRANARDLSPAKSSHDRPTGWILAGKIGSRRAQLAANPFAWGIRELELDPEALHSGLDLMAAAMTFYAVKVASRPADESHPYGHEKLECIASILLGNILGPILFLLVFNVPHILVRWCFTRWGYVLGTGVLQRIQKSGMMESLTYGASIIGLMVVGAMTASMIDITIPVSFGAGEAKTQVQDIINDILPCMLPLVSFGIVYWLLGRKVKPLSIIGGMAVVGILGSWIGLF